MEFFRDRTTENKLHLDKIFIRNKKVNDLTPFVPFVSEYKFTKKKILK